MKPFHELTDFEKSQLFDGEIAFYINLECAREGVELLPPRAPIPPEKGDFAGDIKIWTVAGYHFRDREQAVAVQAAILGNSPVDASYLPGSDYTRKTIGTYTPLVQVTEETWYSPERWVAVRDKVAKYDADMAVYKTELAEYQRIEQARSKIAGRITTDIDAAVCRIRKQDKMRSAIERYLALAQGNTETALEYLLKLYPHIEEDYSNLLREMGFYTASETLKEAA
jgi:hypothetical protein